MSELLHQRNLHDALLDAITDDEAPPFMTAEKEAAALLIFCGQVTELLTVQGICPLPKLMALCQQALRCAAVAVAQDDAKLPEFTLTTSKAGKS